MVKKVSAALKHTRVKIFGISGLNGYYTLEKIAAFPYARVEKLPDFSKSDSDKPVRDF